MELVTFECPVCGFETTQKASLIEVSHSCRGRSGIEAPRRRRLVRKESV